MFFPAWYVRLLGFQIAASRSKKYMVEYNEFWGLTGTPWKYILRLNDCVF